MQEHPQTKYNHYLVALFLGVAGVLILLVFVSLRSQADDNTFSATVSNATPTIDSITVNTSTSGAGTLLSSPSTTPLTLNEQTYTQLYVYGKVSDNNGCFEVASTSGRLEVYVYRHNTVPGLGCSSSTTEKNDMRCYINSNDNTGDGDPLITSTSSCIFIDNGCTPSSTVQVGFRCTFPIKHFADATDSGGAGSAGGAYSAQNWKAEAIAIDSNGARSATSTAINFELATLTSINVSSTLDFGSIAYGAASGVVGSIGSAQSIRIINSGNNASTTIQVQSNPFNCTVGTIGVSSLAYTTSTLTSYTTQATTKVVSSSNSAEAFRTSGNLAIRYGKQTVTTTEAPSTTWWILDIVPSTAGTALGGSCNGVITFTAS